MKRVVIYAVAQVISGLVIFGACAFVQWNGDPGQWTQDARFMAALLWLIGAPMAALVTFASCGTLEP